MRVVGGSGLEDIAVSMMVCFSLAAVSVVVAAVLIVVFVDDGGDDFNAGSCGKTKQ